MRRRTFKAYLIKPSRYDEDGYVVQWRRSLIPSNSLACTYGLFAECAEAKALGPDTDIEVITLDETNAVINVKRIVRDLRASGGGFVGLIGVQSNQFPRALDLGRQFRAAGVPVVIGGFHVSGCLAMLPEMPADMREALDLGISLFAGEAEGRVAGLLRDIDAGALKPIYNYLDDIPDMSGVALPVLPRDIILRSAPKITSFDAGRGCPFQCSFCTIINVQGRKSRYRTADEVEAIVRANAAQGIFRFFVTDDNFARNRNWEAILDRLIELREKEGFDLRLLLQVDTLCHKIPGFVEKAARAGTVAAFIGLENINPESLLGTKKRQNKIWEYRELFESWRSHGVITLAGYILGFPSDTRETIARDIEQIKRELPIDILEFFYLTPLPGSEDHKNLHVAAVPMDPDMNVYDLEHVCTAHPLMSKEEWVAAYRDAWTRFYTDEHMETILRRGYASNVRARRMLWEHLVVFSGATRIEKLHPLQFGIGRRKIRTQRRHGLPIVNPLLFYPWRAADALRRGSQWGLLVLRLAVIRRRALKAVAAAASADTATPTAAVEAATSGIVQIFADKIPKTYGAPPRDLVSPS